MKKRILPLILFAGINALAQPSTQSKALPPAAAAAPTVPDRAPDGIIATGANSAWNDFRNNSYVTYYLRLNGQALGRPLGEGYNSILEGPWPFQLYHELTYDYRFNYNYSVGAGIAGIQDVTQGVTNKFGSEVQPSFLFFHPYVHLSRDNIIDNSWMNLFGEVTAYIPTSSLAQGQTQLFSAALDHTWRFKPANRRLSWGFTDRIWGFFYENSLPDGKFGVQKRTLILAGGHLVEYRLTERFELSSTSRFDCGLYGGKPVRQLDSATEDWTQLLVNYYPHFYGTHIGTYWKTVVSQPSLQKSVIGAEFTLDL